MDDRIRTHQVMLLLGLYAPHALVRKSMVEILVDENRTTGLRRVAFRRTERGWTCNEDKREVVTFDEMVDLIERLFPATDAAARLAIREDSEPMTESDRLALDRILRSMGLDG